MGLPFEPEPIEALKRRLHEAFVRVWSVENVEGGGDRPGLHRENVFDTPQGIRLIVSKDTSEQFDGMVLHVSGSIDRKHIARWKGRIVDHGTAIIAILAAFKEISGLDATGVAQSAMTPGGVVHLVYPLDRNKI